MDNQKKISIIIPIYNVSTFLETCLDSVLAQTFSDFEAILVEDCSTDNSLEIAQKYAQQDPRFVLIQHAQNKGYGAAMNTGIETAKSDWITFLESDDFLASNALQVLWDFAQNGADCVFSVPLYCNIQVKSQQKQDFAYMQWKKNLFVPSLTHHTRQDLSAFLYRFEPWGALYKNSVFTAHNIRFFDEKYQGKPVMYQDLAWTFHLRAAVDKICFINQPLYYYRIHGNNSVSKKTQNSFVFPFLFDYIQKVSQKYSHDFPKDWSAYKHKIFYDIISGNYHVMTQEVRAKIARIVADDEAIDLTLLRENQKDRYLKFLQNSDYDPRSIVNQCLRSAYFEKYFTACKVIYYTWIPQFLQKILRKLF
jgi:glycosyltransferase EpsH